MPSGFTKNAKRIDPYKTYRFQLKWDGATVLGVMKASPLKRSTDVIKHRDGSDPGAGRKSPGRTKYDTITLQRGITCDPHFQQWASKINADPGDGTIDPAIPRKECALEVLNERGRVARRYLLHGCLVSDYTVAKILDSSSNAIPIKSITLKLDGWEKTQ